MKKNGVLYLFVLSSLSLDGRASPPPPGWAISSSGSGTPFLETTQRIDQGRSVEMTFAAVARDVLVEVSAGYSTGLLSPGRLARFPDGKMPRLRLCANGDDCIDLKPLIAWRREDQLNEVSFTSVSTVPAEFFGKLAEARLLRVGDDLGAALPDLSIDTDLSTTNLTTGVKLLLGEQDKAQALARAQFQARPLDRDQNQILALGSALPPASSPEADSRPGLGSSPASAPLLVSPPAMVLEDGSRMQWFAGRCDGSSRHAEGPPTGLLSRHETGFRCDSMAVSTVPGPANRMMIQYVDGAGTGPGSHGIVAFGGSYDPDRGELIVTQMADGESRFSDLEGRVEGLCRVLMRGKVVAGTTCTGRAVQNGKALTATVGFGVDAGTP